ncbi:hypothetical protein JOQ06_000504, partial [Pogonophryne albipinna]
TLLNSIHKSDIEDDFQHSGGNSLSNALKYTGFSSGKGRGMRGEIENRGKAYLEAQ